MMKLVPMYLLKHVVTANIYGQEVRHTIETVYDLQFGGNLGNSGNLENLRNLQMSQFMGNFAYTIGW